MSLTTGSRLGHYDIVAALGAGGMGEVYRARGSQAARSHHGERSATRPEQVRGLAVDHRADMFAFGAVLYEMLTGERAFKGETAADTMSAILTKDPPDLDTAKLSISPALERIVRRCLEKTPELRFESATDLAFALETLSTASTSSTRAIDLPAPPQKSAAAWLPWSIVAAAYSPRRQSG